MVCDNCKTDFEPRKKGRRQRFCPNGGQCRREFYAKARVVGAQNLRARPAGKPRARRIDYLRRIEREEWGFCSF